MAFTLKQQKFIDYYIGASNGNALDAARRAGYKQPHPEGARLLQNATIRAEIDRLHRENLMPPEEVLSRLTEQARGHGAYVRVMNRSNPYVDVEALLADGFGHLIKGIKYTDKGQCLIEFYDAQSALIQIGRHWKLFTDKSEVTGKDGGPIQHEHQYDEDAIELAHTAIQRKRSSL